MALLEVARNRLWSSRGHYPESPLYCDEDVAAYIQDPDWIGVVMIFM
jgi:hypothetical protein